MPSRPGRSRCRVRRAPGAPSNGEPVTRCRRVRRVARRRGPPPGAVAGQA
jgi:hypothetical protein